MPLLDSPSRFASVLGVNPDSAQALAFGDYAYLVQPLDDLSPRVVLQKGAQVGATVLASLRLLWFVAERRMHSLYLFPTHRAAHRFSRGRLSLVLERSVDLRRLFHRQARGEHLRARGVNLYCHGARSRTELLSIPVQYLTIDERDELLESDPAAATAWSALNLARQRLAGQAHSWELNLSTPTLPGRGIAAEFLKSDQHGYFLRCPACRRWETLAWPGSLAWSEAERGRPPSYRCRRCKALWPEPLRRHLLRHGRWQPRQPGAAIRGYHLPRLLSPVLTAERLIDLWKEADGNPSNLQTFHNAVLGEAYLAEGSRLSTELLHRAQRLADFPMSEGSRQSTVLGVDVGPTWLHAVVLRAEADIVRVLWIGKLPDWNELAAVIQRFHVRAFVVDAQPETHAARRFLQTFPQGVLCYYTVSGEPRLDAEAATLHVPRTESLDGLFRRFKEASLLLPRDAPAELIAHMQAPARLVRLGRDGQARAVYQELGPDHYAHAMNYALLALALPGASPSHFRLSLPAPGHLGWE